MSLKASIQDTLSLYFRYIGISLRGQMQYKASFVMLTLGHLFGTAIEFAGVWALFARFGSMQHWRLPEIALFYGLISTAFALAEGMGRGFDSFHLLVKSGDFDRLLLRPRSTSFQVAAREVQLMRIGRLVQGLAILFWALATLDLAWTPAKAALIVLIVFGGACLFYGLLVLQATVAFWTIESLELMNIVTYGGVETGQYPLTIYNPWFRRFFTFLVPLACINYLPVGLLLGPHAQLDPQPWHALTPLVGLLFLFVTTQIWKIGERHYCSTGS